MCSFPSPEAMLKATSVPAIFPLRALEKSSLKSLMFLFKPTLLIYIVSALSIFIVLNIINSGDKKEVIE